MENQTNPIKDIIGYFTTLVENDYEGIQFRDDAHKIECFNAKQDGRVRNA